MRLTSGSNQSTGWSRRCRVARRRDGRDLVSGGAVVSAHELAGVGRQWQLGFTALKPTREGEGMEAASTRRGGLEGAVD
jgi:hypothetical protein